jgi:hypothetical protein
MPKRFRLHNRLENPKIYIYSILISFFPQVLKNPDLLNYPWLFEERLVNPNQVVEKYQGLSLEGQEDASIS